MEKTTTLKPKITSICKALVLSYGITSLMLLLLAFLLYKFHLDEKQVGFGIIAIYLLSCFIGGLYMGKKTGNKKFLWGFLHGCIYFIVLLCISAITNKTAPNFTSQLAIALGMCVLGGTIGGMVS